MPPTLPPHFSHSSQLTAYVRICLLKIVCSYEGFMANCLSAPLNRNLKSTTLLIDVPNYELNSHRVPAAPPPPPPSSSTTDET